MFILSFGVVGCASGLLVSEGEDLMERGEFQEAISRYDEALLKKPAWPQGIEDESSELSGLRQKISQKISESAQKALEELRWEDACQAVAEAEYLDGVNPAGPSLNLTDPVLQALTQRFDKRLSLPEQWGELELIIRGLERCEAPAELIEERLARFAVVATISLDESISELKASLASPAELASKWDSLYRLEHRISALTARLPTVVTDSWQESLFQLRQETLYHELDVARIERQYGLAWAYASLLNRTDEASLYAELARDTTLIDMVIYQSDPLNKMNIAGAPQMLRVERSDHPHAAIQPLSPPAPSPRLKLSLNEETPNCKKVSKELTDEQRIIDHYEERPAPKWLKAIQAVEQAQTLYEARSANLTTLRERLKDELDPLVQKRLKTEVVRSEQEVSEAEKDLTELERHSETLVKSIKTPIYVIFRYPVTEWTLSCELKWTLFLSYSHGHLPPSPLFAASYVESTDESVSWSATHHSVDVTHRAYPQHQVKANPLSFPEQADTLRQRGRAALTQRLKQLLTSQYETARERLYQYSQEPTDSERGRLSQLNVLATLSLTSADQSRAELLARLVMYALSTQPQYDGPLTPLNIEHLNVQLPSTPSPSHTQ